ncbi:MAG: arginine--tRNA ligase [Phycisphaerae bacterium]|nr:arginine--tRNA ligase [Phycisphaerae bacterium]
MKLVIDELEGRISAAMGSVAGVEGCAAIVRPSTDPKFGDYQANGVMGLAKKAKTNPRKLAEEVVKELDLGDICEPPEVAGPGFINLRLKADFLADRLLEINEDTAGLAVAKAEKPKTIVVDFSSPNIAKQMHVGHLRSTILGDSICRMLEFLGHKVIRQNHIGDWGLQMGMVLRAMDKHGHTVKTKGGWLLAKHLDLATFEEYYRRVAQEVKENPEAAKDVRAYTVKLQSNQGATVASWKIAKRITLGECYRIYTLLGVNLTEEHTRGESYYDPMLGDVVNELKEKSLAVDSDGAVCVFPEGFKNKEGQPLPFIIRKSDGAYLYATTDLAAVRYRVDDLKADAIVYVTDSRQKMHFEMLFSVARMAGWASEDVELSHVMFGSILGDDGTPLKTRSGENVKLKELLDEAAERAEAVVEEKNPQLPAQKKLEIAEAVGIGAVKYADYSNNRTSDYVFSFDKMLAMEGNTAPYMQYAYARIKSIERKAQSKDVDIETELAGLKELSLTEPAELDLAKHIIRYGEAIASAAGDYRPNYLTSYLYELAQKFSTFYSSCPVLIAEPEKRPSRLLLCDLTARTIRHGLSELLGIAVVEQM